MRKWFYFFGLIGLVIFFVTLDYRFYKTDKFIKDLRKKENLEAQNQPAFASLNSTFNSAQKYDSTQNIEVKPFSDAEFKKAFKKEVIEISQLQNEPEKVEERMKATAKRLTVAQIYALKNIMLDADQNGDDRAMALELLSLNGHEEAYEALVEMAQQETYKFGSRVDEELAYRAQAIEGLSLYKDKDKVIDDLEKIARKTQYSFINDRAIRAKSFVEGNSPSLPEQDAKALKKLLTK